jgi:hypothetical protein
MARASGRRLGLAAFGLLLGGRLGFGQGTIGSVAQKDASVAGGLKVQGDRILLVGASSVTAREHTADIALARGGMVRVCQTSGVSLSAGASAPVVGASSPSAAVPMMLALDRGAVELKMQAVANDVILTPDLRFTVSHNGPIDLRVRVTRNGDTCVEQHESHAPVLLLSDTFGETTYEIYADQHVLFEHGKLREVVDHENSPCGCPEPQRSVSVAEAALGTSGDASAEHPFPAAESAGLAPTPEIPQAPSGAVHAQVSATLAYEGGAEGSRPTAIERAAKLPSEDREHHGFGYKLRRFFKRLFGGS